MNTRTMLVALMLTAALGTNAGIKIRHGWMGWGNSSGNGCRVVDTPRVAGIRKVGNLWEISLNTGMVWLTNDNRAMFWMPLDAVELRYSKQGWSYLVNLKRREAVWVVGKR